MQFIVPVSLERQSNPSLSSSPINPMRTQIIHAVHIPNKQHNPPPINTVAHHTSHTQSSHTANTYAPPHLVLRPQNSHKKHIVLRRWPFRHPHHLVRNVFVLRIIVTLFWLRIRMAKVGREPRRDCAEMGFGRGFLMTRGEISR